jgi:hypothetical protein
MNSFEEVDAHVNDVLKTQEKPLATASPSVIAPPTAAQICAGYKAVKPVLLFILLFPLPATWKTVMTNYMATCDQFCP